MPSTSATFPATALQRPGLAACMPAPTGYRSCAASGTGAATSPVQGSRQVEQQAMLARSIFGSTGSTPGSICTTAAAPAASLVRTSVPRLPGLQPGPARRMARAAPGGHRRSRIEASTRCRQYADLALGQCIHHRGRDAQDGRRGAPETFEEGRCNLPRHLLFAVEDRVGLRAAVQRHVEQLQPLDEEAALLLAMLPLRQLARLDDVPVGRAGDREFGWHRRKDTTFLTTCQMCAAFHEYANHGANTRIRP